MTARTHDIVAFASLITVATLNPPETLNIITLGAVLIGNIVGALLPDLDQASSRLWDLTPISGLTGQFGRRLFIGHRTISHSLIGLTLTYLILKFLLPIIFNPVYVDYNLVLTSIMIGYSSHLASDLITKEGLPLLFPLRYKFGFPPFRYLRISTGSFMEKFVIFPTVLIYIFWFIGSHQVKVLKILRLIK